MCWCCGAPPMSAIPGSPRTCSRPSRPPSTAAWSAFATSPRRAFRFRALRRSPRRWRRLSARIRFPTASRATGRRWTRSAASPMRRASLRACWRRTICFRRRGEGRGSGYRAPALLKQTIVDVFAHVALRHGGELLALDHDLDDGAQRVEIDLAVARIGLVAHDELIIGLRRDLRRELQLAGQQLSRLGALAPP